MTKHPLRDYTASVEDYLKAIYEIEASSGAAGTNEIADRLAVASASVSGMIRRLADQGLLEHEKYRGVRLTHAGRRVALGTIRRHRIIESYLMQALGYPWDRVHEEAERLEHAASDELVDRMAAAIDEPAVDPHGAPIPTRDGRVAESPSVPLSALEPGQTGHLMRVEDEDADLLRYLDQLGLHLGVAITLIARAPFDGPLTLRAGAEPGTEHIIGIALAHRLQVCPE